VEYRPVSILQDTCLIDTARYNYYIKQNIIDTNRFNQLLLENGILNDFKNKNYNNIDPVLFESCLENSIPLMVSSYEMIEEPDEIIVTSSEEMSEIDESFPETYPPVGRPSRHHYDKATLTYVIKDTMQLNNTYVVDVTLSKGFTKVQLINIIDGFRNKELIDTIIKITPIMRARLLDPANNFKIKPITDSIQNTTNSDLVRWQWQVVPLIEGYNYLTISVDIYIDDLPQNINIYNGKTYVYAYHTWHGDLWNWIEKYWTYITYVIGGICAIIAWLYKEKIINLFKKKDIQ
jgi:hypothetical protein